MTEYHVYHGKHLVDVITAFDRDEALEKAYSWYPQYKPGSLWVTLV